ncbi:MAG: hypothetical protein IJO74_04170 [Clostridia bacterium]|nr:hypothetical protein [Clostridia bacterium]
MNKIKDFFKSEHIEFYAFLPIEAVKIINPKKTEEIKNMKSLAVFLIPYKTQLPERRNVARFCVPYDYHLYAQELFVRFESVYSGCKGYCDNSPISEKVLAASAGLGIIGDNSLLINSKYGSYIFIAEIFFPFELSEYSPVGEILHCNSCGKCKNNCPCGFEFSKCISFVNQTKKLTDGMENIIKSSPYVWGCDLCQDVCPLNKTASDTPVEFFKSNLLPDVTLTEIDRMINDGSFKNRAYAWRGEKIIKRNLMLKEGK